MDTCAERFPGDNLSSCLVSSFVRPCLGAIVVTASVLVSVGTMSTLVFVVTITAGATVVEWTGCFMMFGAICFAILSPQVTKRRP